MKSFFSRFFRNFADSFKPSNLPWHVLAIILTYIIVTTGFDWNYFQYFRGTHLAAFMFSAAIVGGLLPIFAPIVVLIVGKIKKNAQVWNTGLALAQAAMLGSLISSLYKAVTGRAHPDIIASATRDVTHIFQFGFLNGGIFWGWPSSHTTIAFAMAFTLWALFPSRKVKILTLIYALYIGIGVSMTIHWFSDFVAGAIIGTVIGMVVGKSFAKKIS